MKNFTLLILLFSAIMVQAQNSVPNGGFENWTTTTYSYPENFQQNINRDALENGASSFPLTKTAGYLSTNGVQLVTTADFGMAYMVNYNPQDQDPSTWHGGIPYSQKPTGFQGYYKYNNNTGDNGLAIIVFSKNGVNVGTYNFNLGELHTDYTPFSFTFSPALSVTPDSVIVAFASSGFSGAQPGSTLTLDKVSFTGVASQPAQLNGDFEQWTDVTSDHLTNWYYDNRDDLNAIKKTTDAYKENYAVQLTTYLGSNGTQSVPQVAQLMTGYWPNNCSGDCYPLGGYPFTNQTDVLEFYYKYAPMGNDRAQVSLYFKKKGSGQDGWYAGTSLNASSSYTFATIPFTLPFVPDTVIIQLQSSDWGTLSMANIGSTLKIDEIAFQSQKNKVSKTLDVTAGSLSSLLTPEELNAITNLTLTGSIDARDFKTMRDLMPALTSINIFGSTIVAYTGTGGPRDGNVAYPANTIPKNGLYNKTALKNINLPNSLVAIGRSGLNNCSALSSLVIPSGVKVIDTMAFRMCTSLTAIEIPASVTNINYGAFYASGLMQLTLNEGLKTIGGFAFQFSTSLTSINIPASVSSIGIVAFLGTSASVDVNNANANFSSLNGVLYDKNKTLLIYCPAFMAGSFTVPNTVTSIDVDAFFNCAMLDKIELPKTLTTIKQWAFENCTGLGTLTIPENVNQIQGYAFYNCYGLHSIHARPATPVDLSTSDTVFKNIDVSSCILYVPLGSKALYQNAIQWKDFQNIIEEDYSIHPDEGLVAYYPFNGNANDESGNGNNGTVYGATLTSDRFGENNRAYYFNGSNNYIAIDGIINDLIDHNIYSVTGWFKTYQPNHKGTIFSINRETGIVSGQNISMVVWDSNLTYYGDSLTDSQYFSVPFDEGWHYFALTFTKNQLSQLYVDNNLLHQTFSNNMDITTTSRASIGQEWDNGFNGVNYFTEISDLFSGSIDDIRVYNRLLNPSEIENLYEETTTKVSKLQDARITLYPNPTANGFYLPKDIVVEKISIYDVHGARVMCEYISGSYVNISQLPHGIYIVQLQTSKGLYKVKLVKN